MFKFNKDFFYKYEIIKYLDIDNYNESFSKKSFISKMKPAFDDFPVSCPLNTPQVSLVPAGHCSTLVLSQYQIKIKVRVFFWFRIILILIILINIELKPLFLKIFP